MLECSDAFLVSALGDLLIGVEGTPGTYQGWAIDSRKVNGGDIFVALSGDKTDGHEFIEAAIKRGAKAILCRGNWSGPKSKSAAFYLVKDPFQAMQMVAKAWRAKLSCPVIAVAGSVGKTTTKEMTAALLRGAFTKVSATLGSENGFIGIPLTLLRAPLDCEALVVEIGIDAPGAMAQHLEMVLPDIGIVTSIAPEHLEQLHDLDTVAREENLCLEWISSHGGTAVINGDDPRICPLRHSLPEDRIVTYGLNDGSEEFDVIGKAIGSGPQGQLVVHGLGVDSLTMPSPLPGLHNARNLLGAFTIVRKLGLTPTQILGGLGTFKASEGRSLLKTLPSGTALYCDFYNASPASMEAAFATVAPLSQQRQGRRIAFLGDMLELGPTEEVLHRNLAASLIGYHFDMVLTVGPRMVALVDELKKRQFSGILRHDMDPAPLAHWLVPQLKASDVVLIKASRGMALERAYRVLSACNEPITAAKESLPR
jgi:UDP-N-acetylmuramoyl-tripeptide--D-alanyl-D-alanine ligase